MAQSAYLQSLAGTGLTESQTAWRQTFYDSMPEPLRALIDNAALIRRDYANTVSAAIGLIEHTSLRLNPNDPWIVTAGLETPEEIAALCQEAVNEGAAGICVCANHLRDAAVALKDSPVRLVTVHDFPHGTLHPWQADTAARRLTAAGADEIDTVLNYESWLSGHRDAARQKLRHVINGSETRTAPFKVIVKASVHPDYESLYTAAAAACEAGAIFVKTCTGFEPNPGYGPGGKDIASLLTIATVMRAVADHNQKHGTRIGVKISGGVNTPLDCERIRFLASCIMGKNSFSPDVLRIGSSSLLRTLATERRLRRESNAELPNPEVAPAAKPPAASPR